MDLDRRYLVPLDNPFIEDIPISQIARDQFGQAFVGENELERRLKKYEEWEYEEFLLLLAIRPHYLDDIYVVDLSPSNKYQDECFKSTKVLSQEQVNRGVALRGVHIVTLKEYIENNLEFETPLYLIRKPIGYDEVDRIYEITNSGIYNHDNPQM